LAWPWPFDSRSGKHPVSRIKLAAENVRKKLWEIGVRQTLNQEVAGSNPAALTSKSLL
jgi:hypothetical protein